MEGLPEAQGPGVPSEGRPVLSGYLGGGRFSGKQHAPDPAHHVSVCVSASVCIWHCCAAAAKLLQLCPTLCDPIDGSPSGSPVPGILQAGTLKWVTSHSLCSQGLVPRVAWGAGRGAE